MAEPGEETVTLSDDEIETRHGGATLPTASDDTGDEGDAGDTGDDSGDVSDTSDTGDDSGDDAASV